MGRFVRIGIAGVLAAAGAWAAIELARVDADLGEPAGPDRLIRAIDADPAVTAADVAMAQRILRDRPIDGRAYRVLAQAADKRGDAQSATALYEIAARRAPRDRLTRAALLDRAFVRGDVPAALEHLDALLRVAPEARQDLLTRLMPTLVAPEARAVLVTRLAAQPNWRSALPAVLTASTTAPEPAAQLLATLADQGPLLPAEVHARVTLLQRLGRHVEAKSAWLASLPAEAQSEAGRWLFDGGFERPEVEGGFAWRFSAPPGVTVLHDDTTAAEGAQALALVFEGRAVNGVSVEQPLALAPGRYRLTAQVENTTTTARPFVLEVACQPQWQAVAALQLPAAKITPVWQRAAAVFEIPVADCPGQTLRLRHLGRSLNERLISGALRLDVIDIQSE